MEQDSKPQLNQPAITFAGGPTHLNSFLKEKLKEKLFSHNSYFNINSNTKEFRQILHQARETLRQLMNIPNDFQIWYLTGGCHLQFAGIPMNMLGDNNPKATANYTTTGYFSKLSFSEAKRYCNAKSIMQTKVDQNGQFYLPQSYDFDPNAVYTHFVENQSVEGISFADDRFPVREGIPLFDDCSSSFMTRSIDWTKVDMAYAHTQKNCGISGLTVMITNPKTVHPNPKSIVPEVCSWQAYQKKNGLNSDMNIASVYAHYVFTKHVSQNGGLNFNNYEKRAKRMYEVIDSYKIYKARVRKEFRSNVTITWKIEDEKLLQECMSEAAKYGLYEFKGHRMIGGLRASLFCPISDQAVYRLADFLEDFGSKYQ